MKNTIPTQAEYEANEARRFLNRKSQIENSPWNERHEAQGEYYAAMRTSPELVAERVEWLFNGSYGFHECKLASAIKANPRCNRVAQISQLIALVEWQCTAEDACKAWLSLSPAEKQRIDEAVEKAMDESHSATP